MGQVVPLMPQLPPDQASQVARAMSFEERKALLASIARLCKVPKTCNQVVSMIRRDVPALFSASTDELELDLDAVESHILWQWKASIDDWAQTAQPKKKAPRIRAVVRAAPPVLPTAADDAVRASPPAAPPPLVAVAPTLAALASESPGHESEATSTCIQQSGIVLHWGGSSLSADIEDDLLSISDSDSD